MKKRLFILAAALCLAVSANAAGAGGGALQSDVRLLSCTQTDEGVTICGEVSATVPAVAYFAVYDDQGRFLGAEARVLAADTEATQEFHIGDGAAFAKLMLLDASGVPLCGSGKAALRDGKWQLINHSGAAGEIELDYL